MNDLTAPVAARVNGIKASIKLARDLMHGRSFKDLEDDIVRKAAFERSLQIISDASRGLPEDWKAARTDIPWQTIANLGDVISTEYDRLDLGYLWVTAEAVPGPIEDAIEAAVAREEGTQRSEFH
jgi:uncharacterized protein with HEPN domain